MKQIFTVEHLHLYTGIVLILCGLISYFQDGVNMMLSWSIFGAMYISMSDIGECEMCDQTKSSKKHRIRTFAAYLGAVLSTCLLITLL